MRDTQPELETLVFSEIESLRSARSSLGQIAGFAVVAIVVSDRSRPR